MNWYPISSCPNFELVLTKIEDDFGERRVIPLKRRDHLFFDVTDSEIIKILPTHWKSIDFKTANGECDESPRNF